MKRIHIEKMTHDKTEPTPKNGAYHGSINAESIKDVDILVDLRSDTVTRPNQEMRHQMAIAKVGDDVMREDPTVRGKKILNFIKYKQKIYTLVNINNPVISY